MISLERHTNEHDRPRLSKVIAIDDDSAVFRDNEYFRLRLGHDWSFYDEGDGYVAPIPTLLTAVRSQRVEPSIVFLTLIWNRYMDSGGRVVHNGYHTQAV